MVSVLIPGDKLEDKTIWGQIVLAAKAEGGGHEPLGKEFAGMWSGVGVEVEGSLRDCLGEKLKNCTMINPDIF